MFGTLLTMISVDGLRSFPEKNASPRGNGNYKYRQRRFGDKDCEFVDAELVYIVWFLVLACFGAYSFGFGFPVEIAPGRI